MVSSWKFVLFCTPYHLRHDIQIFSDYSILLEVTVLAWKLKKNAKYRQNDFLSFTLKPDVHSSSEMFVTTKWTNSILVGLSCSDKIKCIQKFQHELLMDFKNREKCDILKNASKIYFSQIFKCLVFLKSAGPVYYQLH